MGQNVAPLKPPRSAAMVPDDHCQNVQTHDWKKLSLLLLLLLPSHAWVWSPSLSLPKLAAEVYNSIFTEAFCQRCNTCRAALESWERPKPQP